MIDEYFESFGIDTDTTGSTIQFKSIPDMSFVMGRMRITTDGKPNPIVIPVEPGISILASVIPNIRNLTLEIMAMKFKVVYGTVDQDFQSYQEAKDAMDQAVVIDKLNKL